MVRKIIRTAFFVPSLAVFFLFFAGAAHADETLTWEASVLEAAKHHPDLVSAKEKVNESKASRTQTASGFWPQVSASVDGDRTKSASTSLKKDSYSYGLSGKQLLFDGFKTYFDVEAAAKNVDVSEYNYTVISSNVRLGLRTAFVGLLKAQELLLITEKIEARRKQSGDLIKLRYDAGREHKGSLLTAEANLAQADFEVEQAKRNIDLSERRLTRQLGRTKLTPLKADGNLETVFLDRTRPDFEALAESTPFLHALVVQKEAAKWGVQSSVASLFPQVYASASIDKSDSKWPPEPTGWSAGASLSVPVFEGGNLIAGVSKAKAVLGQAEAEEKSGRDGVIVTLEETWTAFQDAIEQVDVQKKFLEAARTREEIAESEYSTGLISFNDWVIIEDNLVSAEKSYLNALAQALLTQASWAQAKGETLDDV